MSTPNRSAQYYYEKEQEVFRSIPGVIEITQAEPQDLDALHKKYPDAAFALMILENLHCSDREQCSINQTAYFAILNGANISDVRFRYDKAETEYVHRHMWD